ILGALTDEAVRNGSIKKVEKRGKMGEPSKDKNGRDDNKRTRTGNVFATTANPVGRENTGQLAKDCRDVLRNVNPINARKPTVRACYECGSTDHVSFVSTTFKPLLGIEASELGFRYEIEIASGQLVEIDKKVVRIPLLDGKVLRVLGERSEEKARLLMSAKTRDKKQEKIVVVRYFPESPYRLAPSELEELSVWKTRRGGE
ncbi:hypothetical protein Tco_1550655, partial [Tanacetum coccineum]